MTLTTTIDGYVADGPYPSQYHAAFAPPHVDAMLAFRGIAPPRVPRAPFTMVDLGCGDGVGLIASAIAHPEGSFTGIDASPTHIERGRAIATELGVTNVELRCATFADANTHDLSGRADYVSAQGVIAWVSPENRARVFALAAAMLRRGGVLSVGYNALPGWGPMVPMQQAILAASRGVAGLPIERFIVALDAVRANGAFDNTLWRWIDELRADHPAAYFAHEYLNEHWCPLASAAVIAQASQHGLSFAGEARPLALRDDLAFAPSACATIADSPSGIARETARDIASQTWFRIDHYISGKPAPADPAAGNRYWIAAATASDTDYTLETDTRTIDYDTTAARAIIRGLATGPALIDASGDAAAITEMLWIANQIAPADPPAPAPVPAAGAFHAWNKTHGAIGVVIGANGAVSVSLDEVSQLDHAALVRAGLKDGAAK